LQVVHSALYSMGSAAIFTEANAAKAWS